MLFTFLASEAEASKIHSVQCTYTILYSYVTLFSESSLLRVYVLNVLFCFTRKQ